MLDKQGQGYQPVWFVISLIIVFSMLKRMKWKEFGMDWVKKALEYGEIGMESASVFNYKVLRVSWSKQLSSSMWASLLLLCKVFLPLFKQTPQFLQIPSKSILISLPYFPYSPSLLFSLFISLIPFSLAHYIHCSFNSPYYLYQILPYFPTMTELKSIGNEMDIE